MCGIVGYAGVRPGADREQDLRTMCATIVHRGPDDEGHFVSGDVALGMRRLSIIDVAGGKQPIANESGDIHIVFNGEIYNHRALQARLERDGHQFVTHSDTEAIVHLYEEHGDDVVQHLRGMFGFAIWDARRQRLLVARDRVGIKPLYYQETDGGVVFASEVRAIRALTGFRPTIAPSAIAEYLAFGYVPEPHSVYEGVKKLPPGHTLVWERGRGVRVQRYWAAERDEVPMDEQEAVEELRRLIADAVGCHLESEVPLGAFLSGGIDSSTVVAEMARQVETPVRTFSIGFDEEEFNEAPHAATVAKALGTQHTELIVRPDADALVERVILGFDEPFADSSALPTFLVSELARRHVTVALSGDGGDELFGGYTRYAQAMQQRELPALARAGVGFAARRLPPGARGRARLLDLSRGRHGRYTATVAHPLHTAEGGVARHDLPGANRTLDALLHPLFEQFASRDFATQLMLVDVETYLPGDILTKVDRMSMAVSLEARVPLLDHLVVEFAMSVPSGLKLRNGTGKWILRKACESIVPPSVLAKRKQGFGVPLVRWFRHDLKHRLEALARPDSPIYRYVDADAVRRITEEHLAGVRDQSTMLWRLLVLDIWLRHSAAAA